MKSDYERLKRARSFEGLQLGKIAINFGVWTINKGHQQRAGVYFRDVQVELAEGDAVDQSSLNDAYIDFLDQEKIWNRRTNHVAGEHQYIRQEEVYPY
jgi:hypothetical protein